MRVPRLPQLPGQEVLEARHHSPSPSGEKKRKPAPAVDKSSYNRLIGLKTREAEQRLAQSAPIKHCRRDGGVPRVDGEGTDNQRGMAVASYESRGHSLAERSNLALPGGARYEEEEDAEEEEGGGEVPAIVENSDGRRSTDGSSRVKTWLGWSLDMANCRRKGHEANWVEMFQKVVEPSFPEIRFYRSRSQRMIRIRHRNCGPFCFRKKEKNHIKEPPATCDKNRGVDQGCPLIGADAAADPALGICICNDFNRQFHKELSKRFDHPPKTAGDWISVFIALGLRRPPDRVRITTAHVRDRRLCNKEAPLGTPHVLSSTDLLVDSDASSDSSADEGMEGEGRENLNSIDLNVSSSSDCRSHSSANRDAEKEHRVALPSARDQRASARERLRMNDASLVKSVAPPSARDRRAFARERLRMLRRHQSPGIKDYFEEDRCGKQKSSEERRGGIVGEKEIREPLVKGTPLGRNGDRWVLSEEESGQARTARELGHDKEHESLGSTRRDGRICDELRGCLKETATACGAVAFEVVDIQSTEQQSRGGNAGEEAKLDLADEADSRQRRRKEGGGVENTSGIGEACRRCAPADHSEEAGRVDEVEDDASAPVNVSHGATKAMTSDACDCVEVRSLEGCGDEREMHSNEKCGCSSQTEGAESLIAGKNETAVKQQQQQQQQEEEEEEHVDAQDKLSDVPNLAVEGLLLSHPTPSEQIEGYVGGQSVGKDIGDAMQEELSQRENIGDGADPAMTEGTSSLEPGAAKGSGESGMGEEEMTVPGETTVPLSQVYSQPQAPFVPTEQEGGAGLNRDRDVHGDRGTSLDQDSSDQVCSEENKEENHQGVVSDSISGKPSSDLAMSSTSEKKPGDSPARMEERDHFKGNGQDGRCRSGSSDGLHAERSPPPFVAQKDHFCYYRASRRLPSKRQHKDLHYDADSEEKHETGREDPSYLPRTRRRADFVDNTLAHHLTDRQRPHDESGKAGGVKRKRGFCLHHKQLDASTRCGISIPASHTDLVYGRQAAGAWLTSSKYRKARVPLPGGKRVPPWYSHRDVGSGGCDGTHSQSHHLLRASRLTEDLKADAKPGDLKSSSPCCCCRENDQFGVGAAVLTKRTSASCAWTDDLCDPHPCSQLHQGGNEEPSLAPWGGCCCGVDHHDLEGAGTQRQATLDGRSGHQRNATAAATECIRHTPIQTLPFSNNGPAVCYHPHHHHHHHHHRSGISPQPSQGACCRSGLVVNRKEHRNPGHDSEGEGHCPHNDHTTDIQRWQLDQETAVAGSCCRSVGLKTNHDSGGVKEPMDEVKCVRASSRGNQSPPTGSVDDGGCNRDEAAAAPAAAAAAEEPSCKDRNSARGDGERSLGIKDNGGCKRDEVAAEKAAFFRDRHLPHTDGEGSFVSGSDVSRLTIEEVFASNLHIVLKQLTGHVLQMSLEAINRNEGSFSWMSSAKGCLPVAHVTGDSAGRPQKKKEETLTCGGQKKQEGSQEEGRGVQTAHEEAGGQAKEGFLAHGRRGTSPVEKDAKNDPISNHLSKMPLPTIMQPHGWLDASENAGKGCDEKIKTSSIGSSLDGRCEMADVHLSGKPVGGPGADVGLEQPVSNTGREKMVNRTMQHGWIDAPEKGGKGDDEKMETGNSGSSSSSDGWRHEIAVNHLSGKPAGGPGENIGLTHPGSIGGERTGGEAVSSRTAMKTCNAKSCENMPAAPREKTPTADEMGDLKRGPSVACVMADKEIQTASLCANGTNTMGGELSQQVGLTQWEEERRHRLAQVLSLALKRHQDSVRSRIDDMKNQIVESAWENEMQRVMKVGMPVENDGGILRKSAHHNILRLQKAAMEEIMCIVSTGEEEWRRLFNVLPAPPPATSVVAKPSGEEGRHRV